MTPLAKARREAIERNGRKRRDELEARLARQRRINAHAAKTEAEKRAARLERAQAHGYESGYRLGGDPPPLDDEANEWDQYYDVGFRQGAKDKAEEPPDTNQPDEPLDEPESFEQSVLSKLKGLADAED